MAAGTPKVNTAFDWRFKMVDATDFATPETGLTVTVQFSKAGASFAGLSGSPSVSEIGNGWYKVTVASGDMNTTDVILKATATGAAQTDENFYLDDQRTSDVYSRIGAPAGASVSADVAAVKSDAAAIKAKTDNLPSDTNATLAAIAGYIDTEVAAIKAKTDNLPASPASQTKLDALYDAELLIDTTIATLTSQTNFTLTAGSADDNAYFGFDVIVLDAATAVQKAAAWCTGYTGSTKQILLSAAPAFTIAVGDRVVVKACTALRPTTHNRTLDVSSAGNAGVDWANVTGATTAVALTNTSIGNVNSEVSAIKAKTDNLPSDTNATLAAIAGYIDTEVAAIKAKTDNLPASPASQTKLDTIYDQMTEDDGGVRRFTANALEQAPGGAGANPQTLVDTTVTSLTSQTVFRLTAGPSNDDALNNQTCTLYDASVSNNPSVRKILDYVGSTKEITIESGPDFTLVTGDGVKVFVAAAGATAPSEAQVADAVLDALATQKSTINRATGQTKFYEADGTTVRGTLEQQELSADVVAYVPV